MTHPVSHVAEVIKLRTQLGDDPKWAMRYEWFRDLHGLSHDAAVAHALLLAIDEQDWRKQALRTSILSRAAQILAEVFGIGAGK